MSPLLREQIAQLEQTMAEIEAQRALLGDEMGAPGCVKVLKERLGNLEI